MRTVVQNKCFCSTGVLVVGFIYCAVMAMPLHILAQDIASAPILPLSAPKVAIPNAPSKNLNTSKITSKPEWKDLTSEQQLSLKPLAAEWNTLEEARKRKWLALARNYQTLSPTEQAKLHSRMTEWVSLSPQQRTQARLNFARSKQLTPTQKAATWEAYQALTPEEKQKLATLATPKPIGAATASKPVPVHKLAIIPVTRKTPKQTPKLATASDTVNKKTLLPRTPPVEPAPAFKH